MLGNALCPLSKRTLAAAAFSLWGEKHLCMSTLPLLFRQIAFLHLLRPLKRWEGWLTWINSPRDNAVPPAVCSGRGWPKHELTGSR